jgi:hypothetical protein
MAAGRTGRGWPFSLGLAFFLLMAASAAIRSSKFSICGLQTSDIISPYAGASCLLHHCNPYDVVALRERFVALHGDVADMHPSPCLNFGNLGAVYPPSTLLVLAPLAAMDFPVARKVWFWSGTMAFLLAAGLLGSFVPVGHRWLYFWLAGFTLFSATTDTLLGGANPGVFAIALLILALWSLYLAEVRGLGVACLVLALCIKPQLGAPAVAFLLLRPGSRKPALLASALAVCVLLIGVVWLQHTTGDAWLEKLRYELARSTQPGAVNDPSPANPDAEGLLNVETLTSLWLTPVQSTLVGTAIVAGMFLMWLVAFWQRGRDTDPLLALAGLLCISLAAVYHRGYDSRLLLLTLPPLAMLFRRSMGSALNVLAAGILLASVPLLFVQTTFRIHDWLLATHHAPLTAWQMLSLQRQQAVAVLLLGPLWTLALYLHGRSGPPFLQGARA